ncbi:hypothetical protein GOP47_0016264 [Adiantum capillus-veneris]|uniref:DNA methylase N-4/N-6 domain-containing protein n=1 Tax=Adiantum capillus-veneris TaxID=13818 RepID=A0A9D4UI69_ADICA|nr:hypothetical protein GOP47_0016264 [Adiantum capillus-veneris]
MRKARLLQTTIFLKSLSTLSAHKDLRKEKGAGDSGATYKRRDRPSKQDNFNRSIARAGNQEHSQVSQMDAEDVEENGGAEELVDSIVHDLEQENVENVVDQVAIEREEQGADTQRTQEDDQSEEVVVEKHDQVTKGQRDDEVIEGQHDEEEGQHDDEVTAGQDDEEEGQHDDEVTEGQHDDEVTEGQQDDEVTEGQNISNLAGGRRNKLEVFGKILEISTPQAFLERIRVTFSGPPPRIPLCRLLSSEAIRKVIPSTERSLTRSFIKMGGYLESKGAFTVSIIDLEGEETPITQERIDSWDDCWKTINERFERSLDLETEWGPYLKGKMVHDLDGNNRLHAWMECIRQGFENDLSRHCSVVYHFLQFAKTDVGELMFSLARLNKLFQLRRLGEADKTTLLDGLSIKDRAWVEKEMQDEMEQKIEELAKGMDETGRAKVIKKMEIPCRGKTSKYARIADPANGEKFWCATLSLPWHEPSAHIATEEKLNMIGNACITDVDKAHILKLLDSSQVSIRSLECLPNDKAKVRDWLHMYCFWLQVNQYGLGLLLDIQNAYRVRLPLEHRFSNFVMLCRRKYFNRAFRVVEGGIKSTNAMNEQPGLHNATRRAVYRWLLKEIAQHMLDEMPPLASVWTYADNPTFMYSDVKLGRSLSTIEKAKCPWWLDMVKNHVPDEELELFQQHKVALQLTTTTNSVLEEETTATSQVVASTASASFRKTLPINLGREVVHRALQANKAIEDGKMQGQHQSASSSGELRENDDIINETLEPTGTIYVFNISVEELVHIIEYPQQAEQMGLEVLEAFNVVCSQGTVKGTQLDLCIDLIFADFPSNVAVKGCFCNKVPFWNKIVDNLYDTTFQLADSCLSDRGFFVCLYTMEEGVKVEQAGKQKGFKIYHRQVVRCTPPIGKRLGPIVTQVNCLILSAFVRCSTTCVYRIHHDQLPELKLGGDLQFGQDFIFDIVPEADLVKRKGKPWRGGYQRGQKLVKYIIALFSRPQDVVLDIFAGTGTLGLAAGFMDRHVIMLERDERIYDRLLKPFGVKMD